MPSPVDRLRTFVAAHLPNWKKGLTVYASLIAILAGLALGFTSFASQQTVVYQQTYPGSLNRGNTTLALPAGPVTYINVNLSQGDCALRLYPATQTGTLLFNLTGDLPSQWIGCDNRTAALSFNVTDLILVNVGTTPLAYSVTVQGVLVQTPWDWLALPGMGLALAGLLVFVPRLMMREALRMRESYDSRGKKQK